MVDEGEVVDAAEHSVAGPQLEERRGGEEATTVAGWMRVAAGEGRREAAGRAGAMALGTGGAFVVAPAKVQAAGIRVVLAAAVAASWAMVVGMAAGAARRVPAAAEGGMTAAAVEKGRSAPKWANRPPRSARRHN